MNSREKTRKSRYISTAWTPPAVLYPLDDHMGLDIARALTPAGIPVYGIDAYKYAPGRFSKACHFIHCPYSEETDEKNFISFLLDFGKTLKTKAVLYPLSDRHVLLFSQYRNDLQHYYKFVMPDQEILIKLTTKDGLDSIARKYSIPAPQTYIISLDTNISDIIHRLNFPVIIKPIESSYWNSREMRRLLRKGLIAGQAKVVLCQNTGELFKAYQQTSAIDHRLVIQEVIPGDDSNLIYAAFYCNRQSELLGYFSGRKCRVFPIGFGSASYVRSFEDPRLREIIFRFLSFIRYQGLGGVEFKKDARDGSYKLIEFNARFGMWDSLGIRCGVNLPYISYRDALGLPVEKQLIFQNEMIWIDWQRDIRAFIDYKRSNKITLSHWLKSLQGKKMSAIYSKTDLNPGIAFTIGLLAKLGTRIKLRLLEVARKRAGRLAASGFIDESGVLFREKNK